MLWILFALSLFSAPEWFCALIIVTGVVDEILTHNYVDPTPLRRVGQEDDALPRHVRVHPHLLPSSSAPLRHQSRQRVGENRPSRRPSVRQSEAQRPAAVRRTRLGVLFAADSSLPRRSDGGTIAGSLACALLGGGKNAIGVAVIALLMRLSRHHYLVEVDNLGARTCTEVVARKAWERARAEPYLASTCAKCEDALSKARAWGRECLVRVQSACGAARERLRQRTLETTPHQE